jgi:hypothetical protein
MQKFSFWTFTGLLILLLTACGTDYTITTKIFADGSCLRTMTTRLDSSDYKCNPFFIDIDSSWNKTVSWEIDTAKDKTIAVVTVNKKFNSVEAMNNEFYKKDFVSEEPNLTMNFSKKFRWFYTKYRYEETYIQQFPFRHYPLSDYMTQEEIEVSIFEDPFADSVFFAGKDSVERARIEKNLSKKIDDFISENIFEEFYIELVKQSKISTNNFFSKTDLEKAKSEMFAQTKWSFSLYRGDSSDTSAFQILSRLDDMYNTKAFTDLSFSDTHAFKSFDKKSNTDYLANLNNDYTHNTSIPGTLINTNAQKIIDKIPNWNFEPEYFVFTDYTMWVESKRTNKWSYIVTIAVILLAIVMPFLRKRKK